jgi:hypothetical protein
VIGQSWITWGTISRTWNTFFPGMYIANNVWTSSMPRSLGAAAVPFSDRTDCLEKSKVQLYI